MPALVLGIIDGFVEGIGRGEDAEVLGGGIDMAFCLCAGGREKGGGGRGPIWWYRTASVVVSQGVGPPWLWAVYISILVAYR